MTDRQVVALREISSGVRENVHLKEVTYIKLGGPARVLVDISNAEEVEDVIQFALNEDIPFFILGRGCNIVFTDEGFDGIVIRPELNQNECIDEERVVAGAGVTLLDIIFVGHRCGLVGMEALSGIPSSLGGALFGNAGAGGSEIGDFVVSVDLLEYDIEQKKVQMKTLTHDELDFKYRDSCIKKRKNALILSAVLQLKKGDVAAAKDEIEAHMNTRSKAQPLAYPSAGCVFKNPPGESAGLLIQKAGLKGLKIGDMMISDKHGNFILNTNKGTFDQYRQLVEHIKKTVLDKFGIELEEEHIIVKNPK